MVLKPDGTKWACAACLKGHRVSACDHADRELTFVPKKGRPVTQCSHCRSERKKRSAHVKCDCGIICTEKGGPKQKCIHLQDPATGNLVMPTDQSPTADSSVKNLEPADEHSCCCHHGEECTCFAVKKDAETKAEAKKTIGLSRAKPRLTTAQSDGHLSGSSIAARKTMSRSNTTSHDNYRVHKHQPQPHHIAHPRSVDDLVALSAEKTASQQPTRQENPRQSSITEHSREQNLEVDTMVPYPVTAAVPAIANFNMLDDAQANYGRTMGAFNQSAAGFDASDLNLDNVNWDNYPWDNTPVFMDPTNPAYASSNTISEFGAVTPTDQSLKTSAPSMQSMPSWGGIYEQEPATISVPPHDVMQNRFSLPSSFQPGFASLYQAEGDAYAEGLHLVGGHDFANIDYTGGTITQSATSQPDPAAISSGLQTPMEFTKDIPQSAQPDLGMLTAGQYIEDSQMQHDVGHESVPFGDLAQFGHASNDQFFRADLANNMYDWTQQYPSCMDDSEGWSR